jgi:hypothetical protein
MGDNMLADFVVYDSSGRLRLIVEVKNKFGTSPQWAAQLRRNMVVHGVMPSLEYFLLALPDRFYLWRPTTALETLPPDFIEDSASFLGPYFDQGGVTPAAIGEQSLQLIVASWLSECLSADTPEDLPQQARSWLMDSGLFEAVRGGRLEAEASV